MASEWLLSHLGNNNILFLRRIYANMCGSVSKSLQRARTYGLLTKCKVKMAGYWPSSFFACLWTETESNKLGQ